MMCYVMQSKVVNKRKKVLTYKQLRDYTTIIIALGFNIGAPLSHPTLKQYSQSNPINMYMRLISTVPL